MTYVAPELILYGTVAELTNGGFGGRAEEGTCYAGLYWIC